MGMTLSKNDVIRVSMTAVLVPKNVKMDGEMREVYEIGDIATTPKGEGLGRFLLNWVTEKGKRDGKYCCFGYANPDTFNKFQTNVGWYNLGTFQGEIVNADRDIKDYEVNERYGAQETIGVRGNLCLEKFLTLPIKGKVLNIGGNSDNHSADLKACGLNVVTIAPKNADIEGLFPMNIGEKFGAVWCSHTLEHSNNIGMFLKGIYDVLEDEGWVAITVPPLKDKIVGGHLTLFNAGLLLYNMIMAGFDCSKAMVKTYGYNISVIVKKKEAVLPELNYDKGDIEKLANFFPFPAYQGFDGVIINCNWD